MQGRRQAVLCMFMLWAVFEDDAIERIAKLIGCNYYEADMWRRAFAKKEKSYLTLIRIPSLALTLCDGRDSRGPQQSARVALNFVTSL